MTIKEVPRRNKRKAPKTVKWGGSDVFYLRRSLANVQRKLDRIPELLPKLVVEAPDLKPDKLIARIRKRKLQLIKEIAAAQRKAKKSYWMSPIPRPMGAESGHFYHQRSAEWFREKPFPGENIMQKCVYPSGHTSEKWINRYDYGRSWLNHDSTASYGVDDQYFGQYATILFNAELNDDAAWYRDDNPDWIEWGTEVGYYIPALFFRACDAMVTIEVSIRVISEFTNAADDGGSGFHSVAFAHTNPDGSWPAAICDVPSIQDIVLQLNNTGHYDSGWLTYRSSFEVKAKKRAGLALLFITHLSAQDGTVSTYGQWLTSPREYYSFSPV